MRLYLWSIITFQILNGVRPLIKSYGTRHCTVYSTELGYFEILNTVKLKIPSGPFFHEVATNVIEGTTCLTDMFITGAEFLSSLEGCT